MDRVGVAVDSIIDKFLGRFKTLLGPFVIPMFAVDDDPVDYEDGWTVPGLIDRVTKGIKVYVVNAAEIGGGGDGATLAKQEEQIAQLATLISNTTGLSTETTLDLIKTAAQSSDATLTTIASAVATEATALQIRNALESLATDATAQDILTALGPLATGMDVQAVKDAITALGGGSTVDDIVTALAPLAGVATETTLQTVLANIQSINLNVDTIKETLITIEDEVDDLETLTSSIATNTAASSTAPHNYNVVPTSETTTLAPYVCRYVTLIADDNNTPGAAIYVGGGSVDATSNPRVGTPLYRGDAVTYAVTNANLIRHASPTASQILRVEIIV